MKFIAKTAVTLAKAYILLSVFNQLSCLELKVEKLETEVAALREGAKG